MRDLLLAIFWSVALPLSVASPAAGVIFWIWDALLSPTELVYSFMISMQTNKLVAVATLVGLTSRPNSRDFYIDKIGVLLLLLSVSATISWTTALVSLDADTELYFKVIKEVILAFALMFLVYEQRWVHVCALVIALSISFFGVKEGLISLLTVGGHKIIGSRAIGDNNQLAAALLVVIPLLVFVQGQVLNRIIKIGIIGAIFLDIITVIMTLSRGGFIGLLCLGLLYLTRSNSRIKTLAITAILACVLYMLAPDAWFARVDTISDAYDDSSFMGRIVAWKISWLIANDNPLFGGGMHAVQHGPVWYRYSLDVPRLDWWIQTPQPDILPHAAHSIIFEVLGDLGFVGLTLYALLFMVSYANLGKIQRIAGGKPSLQWASDLAQSLKISFIVYLVTGMLLSVAYFELLFIMFALSSRCLRTTRQLVVADAEANHVVGANRSSLATETLGEKDLVDSGFVSRRRRYLL